MNWRRIWAIVLRQIFLQRENPIRFLNTFVWITVEVVLWGFITRYLDSLGKTNFSFSTVLLGAIILWQLLARIQQGVMNAFFEDVWSNNFLNFFASPLRTSEYVAGLVVTGILTTIASFLFVALAAGLLFGYNILAIGLALIPFIAILLIFGTALGILASAIVLRFGPSAEWLAWPIPFIIQPFVGVFYPISVLPASVQIIAKLLPLSYVFESMRSIVLSGSFSTSLLIPLAIGLGLSLLYLLLAYALFLRVYRYILKNGLIAGFNTEAG